ncbi:hypothetical protein D3C75_1055000 [compost metagenome]
MQLDRYLDFPAVDVLTTGNDHVLLAIDQEQIAFMVLITHVSGVVPTVAQGFHGGYRVVPVTGQLGVRTQQHFAGLPL